MGASSTEPVASTPLSPHLRRQRSLASAIATRCCSSLTSGRTNMSSYDLEDIFPPSNKVVGGFLLRRQKLFSWHENSSRLLGSRRFGGSRRRIAFCNGGIADPEADDTDAEVYYKPSPWKLFLRKLRAETKKMNCARPPPPGFSYDAFSYAMNFDDGGWQPPQQYLHSPSSDSSSFKLGSR